MHGSLDSGAAVLAGGHRCWTRCTVGPCRHSRQRSIDAGGPPAVGRAARRLRFGCRSGLSRRRRVARNLRVGRPPPGPTAARRSSVSSKCMRRPPCLRVAGQRMVGRPELAVAQSLRAGGEYRKPAGERQYRLAARLAVFRRPAMHACTAAAQLRTAAATTCHRQKRLVVAVGRRADQHRGVVAAEAEAVAHGGLDLPLARLREACSPGRTAGRAYRD